MYKRSLTMWFTLSPAKIVKQQQANYASQHQQPTGPAKINALFLSPHLRFLRQMLIPLATAAQAGATDVSVYYENQSGPAEGEAVLDALVKKYKSSIHLNQVDKAHAKLLCWDDDHVVITSLNWLSKDIDYQKRLSEIGVYLKGSGLASYVKERYLASCQA